MQSGGSSVVVVVVQLSVQVSVHPLSHSADAVATHELSHSVKISATHELSTATVTHSVMHSSVGLYSQPASPDKKMPPHASSSACAVEGASAHAERTHNENRIDEPRLVMPKGLPESCEQAASRLRFAAELRGSERTRSVR
jgi:hypothetical protein